MLCRVLLMGGLVVLLDKGRAMVAARRMERRDMKGRSSTVMMMR